MADCMGGLSIDLWLEHCVPGEELNLDDLPAEFTNKRFDFRDLIFDESHSGNVEYEEQIFPTLVSLSPFSKLVHGLIMYF